MLIGELLLERSWVDETGLEQALADQAASKLEPEPRFGTLRLCSMLVERGLLDFDHAARALGELHNVHPALTRHLRQRDPELAGLIPSALARQLLAVPIGRGKNGELVVCVRDPLDKVKRALADATQLSIVLAVAPVGLLEEIVAGAYERGQTPPPIPPSSPRPVPRSIPRKLTAPIDEFDVDLSTGPIPALNEPDPDDDIPFASFNLVELDDVGVTKDFSQHSGQFPVIPRTMTPVQRATTNTEDELPIELPKPRAGTSPNSVIEAAPPRRITRDVPARSGPTLRETLAELEHASSSDDATEIGMAFVAQRWVSSLLFTVKEGAAIGHRGHGPNLSAAAVGAVAVPLVAPSIVGVAHDTRKLAKEPPPGAAAIQARLTNLLGLADAPMAAPILVGTHVACILAVGDPQGDPIGTDRAELDKLCVALGAAYTRMISSAKRA